MTGEAQIKISQTVRRLPLPAIADWLKKTLGVSCGIGNAGKRVRRAGADCVGKL
jgi:hypothetical protein